MKDFFRFRELSESKIKSAKMLDVDPYYGKGNARGGKGGGPAVFGVDHKKSTVWFKTKADAKKFVDWKGRTGWDGNADLVMVMSKDGVDIKPTVSGH